jgi:hypothetical protein
MAPETALRQGGKEPAVEGEVTSGQLPKGSWEVSWVKEKKIKLLRRSWWMPVEDIVSYRPSQGEMVSASEASKVVIFFEHFWRGFRLLVSNFMRQFMVYYHLQPHYRRGETTYAMGWLKLGSN